MKTRGVVYALRLEPLQTGFFIEMIDCDSRDQTSDGLFVAMEEIPENLSVGDEIIVQGTVKEMDGLTVLEATNENMRTLSVGNVLPEPVRLGPLFVRGESYPRLENWEGMLVRVQRGIVTGPTDREGVSWFLPGTLPQGVDVHQIATRSRPPLCLVQGQKNLPEKALKVGDQLNFLTGVLVHNRGAYCLLTLDETDVEKFLTPPLSLPPLSGLTLANLRTPGLFRRSDPAQPLDDLSGRRAAFQVLGKMVRVIREVLGTPTLVILHDVENEDALKKLISLERIGAEYDYVFPVGLSPTSLNTALLYKKDQVRILEGKRCQGCTSLQDGLGPDGNRSDVNPANKITCDRNGDGKLDGNRLFARPPLWVKFEYGGDQDPYVLIIIHCLAGDAENKRISARRLDQVRFIADLTDQVDQEKWIVIGALNAGWDSPAAELLRDRGLSDLLRKVSLEDRYTVVECGLPCLQDYVFVREDLRDEFRVLPIHINADYPAAFRRDPNSLYGISPHDPLLVYTDNGNRGWDPYYGSPGPFPFSTPHASHVLPSATPSPTLTNTPTMTSTPYPARLLISEFLPDPPGEEPEGEWIEVYNTDAFDRLLTNYKLGDAEKPNDREGMLLFPPGYYIESGEVLVIANHGETFYETYGFDPDFEIQNSLPRVQDMWSYYGWGSSRVSLSNAGDEILLLDWADRIVDSVSYGNSTWKPFQPPVPAPSQGRSLERYPPRRDRNKAKDWRVKDVLSPGRLDLSTSTPTPTPTPTSTPSSTPSLTPTGPTPTPVPVNLLISEVLADPVGSEPDGEWVELYNPASFAVPMGGVKIGDAAQAGDPEGMMVFPEGWNLGPGAVIVIANQASAFYDRYGFLPDFECRPSRPDVPDLNKYINWATGSVRLRNDGDEMLVLGSGDQIVDQVAYGDSMYGAYQPPVERAGEGTSLQRYPPDVNSRTASDWRVGVDPSPGELDFPTPTPQPTGTPTPSPTITQTSPVSPTPTPTPVPVRLLISEVFPNPDSLEPDGEWIEIYNPQGYPVPLQDVKVGDASMPGDREGMLLFPRDAVIPPGGVIVIANQGAAFLSQHAVPPDVEIFEIKDSLPGLPDMEKYLSWSAWNVALRNAGDEILILDGEDQVVDLMAYGDSEHPLFQPPVGKPAEGNSLERFPPSRDSGSAEDWREQESPSPGELTWSPLTPTPSFTPKPSETPTSPSTRTATSTPTPSPTSEPSEIPTLTPTFPTVPTPTHTLTPSFTPGLTASPTETSAPTPVLSQTPSPSPRPVLIVLNEIHADPHPQNGDANGDGTRHSDDDEFLEFVNVSGGALDLSGWSIHDGVGERHRFPEGTALSEGCAVVVFGGGMPGGDFGGSLVQTTGTLGLNNGGDTIILYDGEGRERVIVSYGSEGGHDQSLTRQPELTGGFKKHSEVQEGVLFSPGVMVDGSAFGSCP